MSSPVKLVVIAIGLCCVCGCAEPISDRNSIQNAGSITIFEGLPHQSYEADLLLAEKRKKSTIEVDHFPFYKETISLRPADEAKIKSILADSRSFEPYAGGKKCGGFHPDFAVEWSTKGRKHQGLICFGCAEYKFCGASATVDYELPDVVRKQLKDILAPYRQNRPAHARWGLWNPD